MNEEKYHSGSSVDEGCAIKKSNTIWKNSDEEHATSGHFGGNKKCEQLEMFDFAVIADLIVPSGSVSSCMGNMEYQYYTQ